MLLMYFVTKMKNEYGKICKIPQHNICSILFVMQPVDLPVTTYVLLIVRGTLNYLSSGTWGSSCVLI